MWLWPETTILHTGIVVGLEQAAFGVLGHLHLVGQVDVEALQFEGHFFRVKRLRGLTVVVAPHGSDRSDEAQLADDVSLAYISSMQDVVDPLQEGGDPWVHIPMSIGYYAQQHRRPPEKPIAT